jgi:hypothetical protein
MGNSSAKKKYGPQAQLERVTNSIRNKIVTDPDSPNKEQIPLESLWKSHTGPTVIILFRRWGCIICRMGALEYSEVKNYLDKKYGLDVVGFYGVGFEFNGYQKFRDKGYFKGKLFIDEGKTLYQSLQYSGKSVKAVLKMGSWKNFKKAGDKGLTGDYHGDGFQLGGSMIVAPTGNVIFHRKQEYYGDDPTGEEVFECIETYYTELENKGKKARNSPL